MAGGTRAGHEAWWAREFERLRPLLARRLRRRGLGWIADDVLAGIGLELTRRYAGVESHDEGDIEDFQRVAWRLTRFRANDQLRAHMYRELGASAQTAAREPSEAGAREERLVGEIDAREFLSHLVERLEELPEEDRALLTRPLEDGDEPLSGRERTRVLRLRKQLARETTARIRGGKHR